MARRKEATESEIAEGVEALENLCNLLNDLRERLGIGLPETDVAIPAAKACMHACRDIANFGGFMFAVARQSELTKKLRNING